LHDYFAWNKPRKPKDVWSLIGVSLLGLTKQFMDKQFLSSLSDTVEAIQDGDGTWFKRQVAGHLTRSLPGNANLLRMMDKIFEDDKAYSPETLGQQIVNTLPFFPSAEHIPVKYNVAGKVAKVASPAYRFAVTPRSDEYMTWTGADGNPYNMKDMIRIIAPQGARIPPVRSYEMTAPDGRYFMLEGRDRDEYIQLRTNYLNALLIKNEAEIRKLAKQKDPKDLKQKLSTLASTSTKDAKKSMMKGFDPKTLRIGEDYSNAMYGIPKEESEE
jgi:hypothetical protein